MISEFRLDLKELVRDIFLDELAPTAGEAIISYVPQSSTIPLVFGRTLIDYVCIGIPLAGSTQFREVLVRTSRSLFGDAKERVASQDDTLPPCRSVSVHAVYVHHSPDSCNVGRRMERRNVHLSERLL